MAIGLVIIEITKQIIYKGGKVAKKANINTGTRRILNQVKINPIITTKIKQTGIFPMILPGSDWGSTLKALGNPKAMAGIGKNCIDHTGQNKSQNHIEGHCG